jgi:predicted DNA-binding transcriptional regulator YafY
LPRNAEIIRQWTILREIERARAGGVTIDELASQCQVTTRTIRRDLQALEAAGFPIYDDRSQDDGRTRWRLNGQAFRSLTTGLTFAELCALYFSRTLLESLSGTPFRDDLARAFDKLGAGLTPHMRRFLDQLPRVIAVKSRPAGGAAERARQTLIARTLEATLDHRQASITYHSSSSLRTKLYLVHPYRLAYAEGGLYLLAWVPEYHGIRTFAIDRIHDCSLHDEHFTPREPLPDEAFPHSLGVHSGPPEHVRIAFTPEVAAYVQSRVWHTSQQTSPAPDGGLLVELQVCVDPALRSWILGFGASARVLAPPALATAIEREHSAATALYAPAAAAGADHGSR